MSEQQPTIRRHSGGVRLAHVTLAVAVGWLILSGLGIHENLPAWAIHTLGGHVLLVTSHRWLGYVLAAALLLALIFLRHRVRRFLGAIVSFHRADAAWLPGLLRSFVHVRDGRLPWHAGRFDPLQRLAFLILIGSLVLLIGTGIAVNFIPASSARMAFVWTLRTHLTTAWVFITVVGVHVFAGLGILPTHRGVIRAMFGDGRVTLKLSRRLWPGWTQRQLESNESDSLQTTPAATDKAAARNQ